MRCRKKFLSDEDWLRDGNPYNNIRHSEIEQALISVLPKALDAIGLIPDQRQEFRTGFLLIAEAAEHRRGYCRRVLLFYSAHHHAKVAGFNDNAHSLRFDGFLNRLGNLGSQPFLDLQAPGKDFDEPRNLAQANDFAFGNIGDVNLAKERQHVVLAEAEHLDVFDDHHLVITDGEQRLFQQGVRIFFVALGKELEGAVNAIWGADEAFAIPTTAFTSPV